MKKTITTITLCALLIISFIALMGSNNSMYAEDKAAMTEVIRSGETLRLNLAQYPTETGYVEDMTEEEKTDAFDNYASELKKYYTDPLLANFTENCRNFYFYDENPETKYINYTVNGGVNAIDITDIKMNADNTEATVTADVEQWIKDIDQVAINQTETNLLVNTSVSCWSIEYIMKKEDGKWKIAGNGEMHEKENKARNSYSDESENTTQYYNTFNEAVEAAKAIDLTQ